LGDSFVKIRIKKKLQFLEEAKTFEDTVKEMDGKFTKSLQGILKSGPDSEAIANIKKHLISSVPDDLEDGDKVQVINWLKKKVLTPDTPEGDKYSFLMEMVKNKLTPDKISAIENYYKVKKYASENQIAKINSFEQMKEITAEAEPSWAAAEEKKTKKAAGKVDKSKLNIEELQSPDPNWEILLPHDQNSAMHLGSICLSNWCTSARGTRNLFNRYYKEDGSDPLIIFKHKSQKEKIVVDRGDGNKVETEVPLMYQIHFGQNQFMDRGDSSINKETKIILLDLIQNSKTKDGKPTEEKYPIINNIKAYETEKGIVEIIKNKNSGKKEWFLNGKLHREDGPAMEQADGSKRWFLHGNLHREDGPAVEYADGRKEWRRNGKLHREDGPAWERPNETKQWWLNGKLHREDGPAMEQADGTKEWYLNGKRHREDGPAMEQADGTKYWYLNGNLHREDGPAMEIAGGRKHWFLHGMLHREDGPAVEYEDGTKYWHLNGKQYGKTYKNDMSTPEKFIKAGGKEWDWKNDPWLKKKELKEHFSRFRKLWL